MSVATEKSSLQNSDSATVNTRLMSSDAKKNNLRLTLLLCDIEKHKKAAFEKFYDSTIKLCFSQALRITLREDIAEEVVSDVYMQVWNKAGRYDAEKSSVHTWLMMLCRSRSLDALRLRKNQFKNEVTNLDNVAEPVIDDQSQTLINATQESGSLHAAIKILKPQQQQLLSLAYFKDLSHSEIARLTDIPLGTVKTQIRRAIIQLRDILQQQVTSGGEYYE